MAVEVSRITFEEVLRNIYSVLDNPDFQRGVDTSASNFEKKIPLVLKTWPELVEVAKEVKRVKEEVLKNPKKYIDQAMESLRKINAKPYLAETAEEAREIIARIIGDRKLIVMSKSMVAEEIGLREYLEELGKEVWETDLGQFLVQVENGRPMHPIAPAIHMRREYAAKILREKLGFPLKGDESIEDIVKRVRMFLRDKIKNAEVGISGANAVAADTGAIFLVENESNIRLVTGFPPIHIAVTGVDKIVPTFIDAMKVIMAQSAYIALYPPTYVDVIAGPSSTGDIELHRVFGAQGPLELHVVFVDNGRLKASQHPVLKEQLKCIRCGRCCIECPVWRHTANIWGGPTYGGPMGINWTAITLGEEVASELAHLCLGCGRCRESCPMEIPIDEVIRYLKTVYNKRHGI